MSNQDIDALLSSYRADVLRFSLINKVGNLDAHVKDIVQFIEKHDNLKTVTMDEPLAIDDEKKKKEIYDAFLRNPHITTFYIGPDESVEENYLFPLDRFALDISIALWVSQVLSQVKTLLVLYIEHVDSDNEAAEIIARALRRNRALKQFWLIDVNKDNDGDACDIVVQAILRSLRFRVSLRTITVRICPLSEATFAAVAEALQLAHSSLELLEIDSKENLPAQIGANILNAIVTNKTLEEAYLLNFGADTPDNAIGAAISRLLSNNTTLQLLHVGGPSPHGEPYETDDDEDIDVNSFVASLALNRSLKDFGLYSWGIRDRGIQRVCEAVTGNKVIESLALCHCNFGLEGLKAIRDLLSHESALMYIDVGFNRINDESISYICEPLERNDTIEILRICGNVIGEEGAVIFGRSLTCNNRLKHLDLARSESMGERGIRAILDAVKSHSTITEVLLGNSWDTAIKNELHFYLERNKGAKKLLSASPPLPLSLWPHILKKADSCRLVPKVDQTRPPDVLYDLIKEKVDLFCDVSASRERKRRRTK